MGTPSSSPTLVRNRVPRAVQRAAVSGIPRKTCTANHRRIIVTAMPRGRLNGDTSALALRIRTPLLPLAPACNMQMLYQDCTSEVATLPGLRASGVPLAVFRRPLACPDLHTCFGGWVCRFLDFAALASTYIASQSQRKNGPKNLDFSNYRTRAGVIKL